MLEQAQWAGGAACASNLRLIAFSPVLVTAKQSSKPVDTSRTRARAVGVPTRMRALAIGIAIAVVVFALTGGHLLFLPLLFLPLGLFSFGHRKKRRDRTPVA